MRAVVVVVDGSPWVSVRTADVQEIESTLSAVFGGIRLRRDRVEHPFLRLELRRVDGLQIVRWRMSGSCGGLMDRREVEERAPVLLGLRMAGTVELESASGEVDTAAPYLCPDPVDCFSSASDILNLAIDRTLIDAQARSLLGDDDFDVRFLSTAPIDPVAGDAWRNTIAYATRTLSDLEGYPQNELLRAAVVDLVSAVAVRTFPNTALDSADYGSTRASAAVRRAIEFIEGHLAEPIRIPDLAAAAQMSVRGLHAAFQRDVGSTPMAYVRRARMTAVRTRLAQSDPAGTDVREVVRAWGFTDHPRFVARYAREFGETPEETLLH